MFLDLYELKLIAIDGRPLKAEARVRLHSSGRVEVKRADEKVWRDAGPKELLALLRPVMEYYNLSHRCARDIGGRA